MGNFGERDQSPYPGLADFARYSQEAVWEYSNEPLTDETKEVYKRLSESSHGLLSADALVVTSLDRLARQMTQQEGVLAEVWKAGRKVFALGDGGEVLEDDPDDPMRTAIRQMRGVFAQLERGLIRQRMAKGKREKRSQGGYVGGAPPFGYTSDHQGTLMPDPAMQRTVERIVELDASAHSLRQIIEVLDTEGLRPRKGGAWYPATVARILASGRR